MKNVNKEASENKRYTNAFWERLLKTSPDAGHAVNRTTSDVRLVVGKHVASQVPCEAGGTAQDVHSTDPVLQLPSDDRQIRFGHPGGHIRAIIHYHYL